MKKKLTRFVVYLDEGDKPLLAELKRVAKKHRLSASAVASFSIQIGLPILEARFEKLSPKKEVSK